MIFDPSVLAFSTAAFGDPVLGDQLDVDGLGTIVNVTPGFGTVELFELSLDAASDLNSLQVGRFVLCTLRFNTLSVGTSPLNLSVNALGDAEGNSLAASMQGGSVNVVRVAIPEPNTLSLLVLVISAGLGFLWVSPKRVLKTEGNPARSGRPTLPEEPARQLSSGGQRPVV